MGNVTKSGSSNTIRKPVDTKPIDKDDLVAAYLERHRDSDYGFQAEFEQLPTSFADRTTGKIDIHFDFFRTFLNVFVISLTDLFHSVHFSADHLNLTCNFLSFFIDP